MVTMMVNVFDDDCCLVMKVILVKEVMSCDVSPVAMFWLSILLILNCLRTSHGTLDTKSQWLHLFGSSPISIGFKMSPQSTWIGACIVIMIDFLLFATVCYQMYV